MNETIGEIDYHSDAELKVGASYPSTEELKELTNNTDYDANYAVELTILEDLVTKDETDQNTDELTIDSITLQAKYIAQTIKNHIQKGFLVYDGKKKQARPVEYKDFVILLRSMNVAQTIMEELKQADIPAYANLSDGYFESIEVMIILDLLSIIDNPYQDIPLAGVLRSPIVGLTENELAYIRKDNKHIALIDCVRKYKSDVSNEFPLLEEKIKIFNSLLMSFRNNLKHMSVSELIWDIYKQTNYYHYVGGLPGGKQRQANLRALYDRSISYESTSYRGLFNFLQFIKMMKERGDDLGTARALGEQENVVRLMTIHSSKGLEFPVVFVAHINKNFNEQDLRKMSLLDKDFGLAVKMVDLDRRITTPTIFYQAMKQKKIKEMQAEEMRILYVALTRAKEKLYLVGSVDNLDKKSKQWKVHETTSDWLLDDYQRLKTKSYLDWVAPSILRHQDSKEYSYLLGSNISANLEIKTYPSHFKVNCLTIDDLDQAEATSLVEPITNDYEPTELYEEISKRLSFEYPYSHLVTKRAKQSVSEIKKNQLQASLVNEEKIINKKILSKRPDFMKKDSLTGAEKGTVMHKVMQHIPFELGITIGKIEQFIQSLENKEILTKEEAEVISATQILEFFQSELGQRMIKANNLQREVPFSLGIPASEVYLDDSIEETILVQGIIDCLFEEDESFVIVDFKTDSLFPYTEEKIEAATKSHQLQLEFYKKGVETIYHKNVKDLYIYFFDGGIIQQLKC